MQETLRLLRWSRFNYCGASADRALCAEEKG
jgi:hypothetical protein